MNAAESSRGSGSMSLTSDIAEQTSKTDESHAQRQAVIARPINGSALGSPAASSAALATHAKDDEMA